MLSPAQQPEKTTVPTKVLCALLSLHTDTTMRAMSHGPRNSLAAVPGQRPSERHLWLMCLRVFTAVRVENVPIADAAQGAATAEVNVLPWRRL